MIASRVRMRPSTNACSLRASSYSGVFWAPTISLASCMRWATSARRTLISSSSSFCSLASPSLVRGTDLPGMAITPRPCEKRDWGRVYPQSSRCSRRFRRYYRAAPAACKEGDLHHLNCYPGETVASLKLLPKGGGSDPGESAGVRGELGASLRGSEARREGEDSR